MGRTHGRRYGRRRLREIPRNPNLYRPYAEEVARELRARADAELRVGVRRGAPRPCGRSRTAPARSPCSARPSAASSATCRSVGVSSPRRRGRRPPTRASSARACSAQPGEPSASKAAAARSSASRAAPHCRAPPLRAAEREPRARGVEAQPERARRRPPPRASAAGGSSYRREPHGRAAPRGREPPRMLLGLGERAQPLGRRRCASSARRARRAPRPDPAPPGTRRARRSPRARVCSHTARRCSAAARRVVREQRRHAERPPRLEHLPAVAARLGLRERRRRPALGLVRPARGPAASSARQRW